MKLSEIEAELDLIISDTSLAMHFKKQINNVIEEITTDFDMPALKLYEAVNLNITSTGWLYDMPATYQKNVFKCHNSAGTFLHISFSIDDIVSMDHDHSETGDKVTHVAFQDGQAAVYPKPIISDVLSMWYYKKPTVLTSPTDELTCIPNAYQRRVVIAKLIVQNYELLQDMAIEAPLQSLAYWENKYRSGLFGSQLGDIGMIEYIAVQNKDLNFLRQWRSAKQLISRSILSNRTS